MKTNADERNFLTVEQIAEDFIQTVNEWSDDKVINFVVEFPDGISCYLNDYYYEYDLTAEEVEEITQNVIDFFGDDNRIKRYCGIMYNNTVFDIIEYLRKNEDIFNTIIEELDGVNGYIGDGRYYPMDEIDEFFGDSPASEIIARAFYGYDENYFVDSSSNKTYSPFNPNRDYFKFNGYGNLVSTDYKDYSSYLDNWLVESLSDNKEYLYSIDDDVILCDLFTKLEKWEALK